jgi:hypothetical protein
MHRPLLFVAALLAAQPAQAETLRRCGWFVNPTPGNFVLQDADGNWWIQMQGSPPAPGFEGALDRAQPFGTEWVNENTGGYGYGCACLDGIFGAPGSSEVLSLTRMKPLPLAQCRNDPALPQR